MLNEIQKYAQGMNASKEIIDWLGKRLPENYDQSEIEHIIDYLVAENPKLTTANYEQIKKNADKWLATQIKKGNNIKETSEDTEIVLDFKDGFKFVKLVGKNAYKREGFLMSSCVESYFGKDDEIYSLRDNKNLPHATLSKSSQQIKGKGNGKISPLYIRYVVEFLEYLKIEVRDNEMNNLGYVNIEKADKNAVFPDLFRSKYFYKQNLDKIVDKNGDRYENITLWRLFGLFDFDANLKVKLNFDIKKCVETFKKLLKPTKKLKSDDSNEVVMDDSNEVAMDDSNEVAMHNYNEVAMHNYNEVAMHNYNEVAMHNYNKVAMDNYNEVVMDDSNKVAMEDYNEVAMDDYNEVAMRNSNKVAMDNYNEVVMDDSNKVAMEDSNKVAMDDYNEVAMRNSNKVVMRNYNEVDVRDNCRLVGNFQNKVTIGKNSIALMGKESQIKGTIGGWMSFIDYEKNEDVKNIISVKIDGVKIKEDTWYTLKDGIVTE